MSHAFPSQKRRGFCRPAPGSWHTSHRTGNVMACIAPTGGLPQPKNLLACRHVPMHGVRIYPLPKKLSPSRWPVSARAGWAVRGGMISQFFILTPRGDTVVSKDYRGDCPRGKHSVTPLFVSSLGVVCCRDFISDALKSDDVRSPCQRSHTHPPCHRP